LASSDGFAEVGLATDILPALIIIGIGIGLALAPAMQGAVSGVDPQDPGVASATVNTMQQIGGSTGTALLSTMAASAAADYLATRTANPGAAAQAAVESYITVFWWAAAIFTAGSLITAITLRSGRLAAPAEGATVIAH
jgi:hypothetical protein